MQRRHNRSKLARLIPAAAVILFGAGAPLAVTPAASAQVFVGGCPAPSYQPQRRYQRPVYDRRPAYRAKPIARNFYVAGNKRARFKDI